ncbi:MULTISPECIES: CinA family protein [unclassified Bartonella]|uniref:CinA family protein n=1 Tax=unclassified Bartonella TaxID=2645622 RepID=UPI0015FD9194|nr:MULTISPECIES: CinA family protein [unclassified Bartonella]UXN07447.1 CinA family protein [Bartonella sp. HY761]
MIDAKIIDELAREVLNICRQQKLLLATVESCTGGMIAAALTDIAGSSDVVECGFVTYSNEAKMSMVGVDQCLLEKYGAVSEPVAIAMAKGALQHSRADISIAVTGIAGPAGGGSEKPVGLVHLAVAFKHFEPLHFKAHFGDIGRRNVRQATVVKALELIIANIRHNTEA